MPRGGGRGGRGRSLSGYVGAGKAMVGAALAGRGAETAAVAPGAHGAGGAHTPAPHTAGIVTNRAGAAVTNRAGESITSR